MSDILVSVILVLLVALATFLLGSLKKKLKKILHELKAEILLTC